MPSNQISLYVKEKIMQFFFLKGNISCPNDVTSKNLRLTFHHFFDLSHSYRFVTSPGCWLRLSTHVTTMSNHKSKSSTQVVMETTSNLQALTFDPWQVERLSLEQFGQGWWACHHVLATVGKNIMVLRRVSFGWDWWVYLWGLGNMCQRECHGSFSVLKPNRQWDDSAEQTTKHLS